MMVKKENQSITFIFFSLCGKKKINNKKTRGNAYETKNKRLMVI